MYSGENLILRGIFHVVSCFPLHFMFYLGNLDYFSDSVMYFAEYSIEIVGSVVQGGWKGEIPRGGIERGRGRGG